MEAHDRAERRRGILLRRHDRAAARDQVGARPHQQGGENCLLATEMAETAGPLTPAAAPRSSIETPLKPDRANSAGAASSRAARRSALARLRWVAGGVGGWVGGVGGGESVTRISLLQSLDFSVTNR